jgi:hypothetical protein
MRRGRGRRAHAVPMHDAGTGRADRATARRPQQASRGRLPRTLATRAKEERTPVMARRPTAAIRRAGGRRPRRRVTSRLRPQVAGLSSLRFSFAARVRAPGSRRRWWRANASRSKAMSASAARSSFAESCPSAGYDGSIGSSAASTARASSGISGRDLLAVQIRVAARVACGFVRQSRSPRPSPTGPWAYKPNTAPNRPVSGFVGSGSRAA